MKEQESGGYRPISAPPELAESPKKVDKKTPEPNKKFEIQYEELKIGETLGNGVKLNTLLSFGFLFVNSLSSFFLFQGIWNCVKRPVETNALCHQGHQQTECV
jgi:hypothetical protein